jgi:hypothetical protein
MKEKFLLPLISFLVLNAGFRIAVRMLICNRPLPVPRSATRGQSTHGCMCKNCEDDWLRRFVRVPVHEKLHNSMPGYRLPPNAGLFWMGAMRASCISAPCVNCLKVSRLLHIVVCA